MTKTYKMVEKQFEELSKIYSKCQIDLKTALTVSDTEFGKNRTELKKKLTQQKTEEQELINNFQKTDNELSEDLERISLQMRSFGTQNSSDMFGNYEQQKGQQLDQIFMDMHRDVATIIDKHKERVKRLDQMLAQNKIGEQSSQQSIALRTKQKAIIDRKNQRMAESMNNLESIRKEIEQKLKELEELDRKESDQLSKVMTDSKDNENKDREKEMSRFAERAKYILRKH